jgi:hypothetical protein
MILSDCRKQAREGCEPNIHKASFTERRLFYLNYHSHRHTCTCVRCKYCEGVLVLARSNPLSMTNYMGMR